jgi:hypothetical protein
MSHESTLNTKQKNSNLNLVESFSNYVLDIIIVKNDINDNPSYFLMLLKFEKSL